MDNEFQQISRRLAGLAAKRPGFVIGLWGEPGIGKTHTALELLRGAPCRSFTVHATQPPETITNAIPRPKKISIWLERSLERLKRGEVLEAGTLIQALAALLAANAPIILHVEDLHEAEADRLEFWTQLAPIISRMRGVGLIVTSRAQLAEGFESIRLSALNREASDALLEAEAGATLPPEALGWVFEKAAGNPLYTLEFFRFLARQGFLWNDGRRWRWRVPEREVMPVTVEALIERRLRDATSTPALESAVRAKALLGLGTTETLWAEVADLKPEDLAESKRELERQGVLFDGEFAHPLYREVIGRNLTSDERQTLARRALAGLKDDPATATAFVEAARLEPEVAMTLIERGADAARKAGNEIQAAWFEARAVEYAVPEKRGPLALLAARGLRRTDVVQAAKLAEIAFLDCPEHPESIDLYTQILAGQGKLVQAEEIVQQLSQLDQTSNFGSFRLILLRSLAGSHSGVLEIWHSLPELQNTSDPKILYAVAFALASHNKHSEAEPLVLRGLSNKNLMLEDRCQFTGILGAIRYFQNDSNEAARYYAQAVELAFQAQRSDLAAIYLANRGAAQGELGKNQEKIVDLQQSMQIYAESGNRIQFTRAQVRLADALLDLGEYEKVEETLLESLCLLETIEPNDFLVECEYRLSQLYRDWGMKHSGLLAVKHAKAALKYARQIANPRTLIWSLCYAANAEARFGNRHAAENLALEASQLAAVSGSKAQIGMAQLAQGLALEAVGHHELSLITLKELESRLRTQGFTDPAQEVGLEVDRISLNAKNASSRLQWFEQNGLLNMANIARRYFPELGLDHTQTSNMIETSFRLEVLGSMQLRQRDTITSLRGGKRKELLALLLEARIRGRAEVSSLDLCEALYALEPEEVALGALKATVHKIRQSLGTNLISTTPNGYALGAVTSDAEEFLQTGDTRLWRGPYLEDAALEGRDENVREALHHALETQAQALLKTDPQEAARLGHILLAAEPYDVGALEITCRALQASKNHRGVLRLYTDARTRLLEVGENLPEHWADFLEAPTV